MIDLRYWSAFRRVRHRNFSNWWGVHVNLASVYEIFFPFHALMPCPLPSLLQWPRSVLNKHLKKAFGDTHDEVFLMFDVLFLGQSASAIKFNLLSFLLTDKLCFLSPSSSQQTGEPNQRRLIKFLVLVSMYSTRLKGFGQTRTIGIWNVL